AALRRMSAATANVVRGGERRTIPATELVPGDIMLIEEGDTIPADGRLIQSTSLTVSEAALTGESEADAKDTAPLDADAVDGDGGIMVYCGMTAPYGRSRAVVTVTGMRTEMGRIAGLLQETPEEETPLQAELDKGGKRLGAVVVVIALVMIATILLVTDVQG